MKKLPKMWCPQKNSGPEKIKRKQQTVKQDVEKGRKQGTKKNAEQEDINKRTPKERTQTSVSLFSWRQHKKSQRIWR